jgi:hypothetical protein
MGYVHLMTKELSVAVDDDGVWQLRGTAAEKFGLVNEFLGYLADRNFSARTCRVAADLPLRISDPALQDAAPIINHPGPPTGRRQTSVTVVDRFLHGVVRTPAQLCSGAIGPGQVIGLEYFHEFSVRLQVGLSWGFRFD